MTINQTILHDLPKWVPEAARHYLEHTEAGQSIRALARARDCHPSTVLRQVRRVESRRDDPLVDSALATLSRHVSTTDRTTPKDIKEMHLQSLKSPILQQKRLTNAQIEKEARSVLRRLCEQGAVLAVAREMETAVVVRQTAQGDQLRTAAVGREIAQAMALKDWIVCEDPEARVSRYFITNAGRAALRKLLADDENMATGLGMRAVAVGSESWDQDDLDEAAQRGRRLCASESPLEGLARRKDKTGKPFLTKELVAAGEQLREDFELVAVGLGEIDAWAGFMHGETLDPMPDGPKPSQAALDRIRAALADLGPGLGDIALRCCCYLEGLEQTEKRLGWSARSGKIVLRIALQRLKRHYAETQGKYGPMIG